VHKAQKRAEDLQAEVDALTKPRDEEYFRERHELLLLRNRIITLQAARNVEYDRCRELEQKLAARTLEHSEAVKGLEQQLEDAKYYDKIAGWADGIVIPSSEDEASSACSIRTDDDMSSSSSSDCQAELSDSGDEAEPRKAWSDRLDFSGSIGNVTGVALQALEIRKPVGEVGLRWSRSGPVLKRVLHGTLAHKVGAGKFVGHRVCMFNNEKVTNYAEFKKVWKTVQVGQMLIFRFKGFKR
jgi:hypothetical protein